MHVLLGVSVDGRAGCDVKMHGAAAAAALGPQFQGVLAPPASKCQ